MTRRPDISGPLRPGALSSAAASSTPSAPKQGVRVVATRPTQSVTPARPSLSIAQQSPTPREPDPPAAQIVSEPPRPLERTAPTAVIELRNVSRQFGSQHVLRDVSIDVFRGETLALIGESGCGKSVTLKLMMALLAPSEGEVSWFGKPVHERSTRDLICERLRFGYLFQGAALFDSLTVYENVAFGLRQNTRASESDIRQTVIERVREVGLPETVCTKKPAELSGGMRKRVGLARALAMNPEVMFYDEPTTGLDPIMSDVINELILRTSERMHVTSVVVTHDMRTVEKVAHRVVMLYPLSRIAPHQPQIVFTGTAPEAFASADPRVSQFIRGEARERMQELAAG